jgi:hypothetical protein
MGPIPVGEAGLRMRYKFVVDPGTGKRVGLTSFSVITSALSITWARPICFPIVRPILLATLLATLRPVCFPIVRLIDSAFAGIAVASSDSAASASIRCFIKLPFWGDAILHGNRVNIRQRPALELWF